MNLVSWNCRGLGTSSKVEAVKDLVIMALPYILLLQETKIEAGNLLSISNQIWKKNIGKAVSARGSSGGLAMLWSEDLFSLENYFLAQHWIFTELRHSSSKLTFSLFNLYVPVTLQEKRDYWNSLAEFLAARNPSNIIIAGDLNIMLAPKEKKGGNCGRDPMIREVERIISS